ncbi:Bifunctional purine biosynthetic protein ade1 [Tieghemiomyces parasiticus]|uniref:Phosphoribosylaminoimidazole-succinocarboxamide synthase n=1 Tax=Tieghemiomyces parasiticus TaxID=78921 RepID=A0A9W7ZYA8_9FUNG|nr:Bifunctional purine biosynthetic protein ade1 [Tieghemiomyces parasiticus]
MTNQALLSSHCPELRLISRGKVRDLYDISEDSLLFVATDRISAFDVVMKTGIPGKGKILTQLSVFWFNLLQDVLPNHLITADIDAMPAEVQQYRDQLAGRSLLVKKVNIFPVEAIVRGYISGSGWKEYKAHQTVCDIPLPANLVESQKLPAPLFTPSTKADLGEHDMNIHPSKVAELIGQPRTEEMEKAALALYNQAHQYAATKGILIADTKFEFGWDPRTERMVLADEVLTPDSSRFWDAQTYQAGSTPTSFDKQYLRDYLTSVQFDGKTSLDLPEEITRNTLQKYIEAFRILTGKEPEL